MARNKTDQARSQHAAARSLHCLCVRYCSIHLMRRFKLQSTGLFLALVCHCCIFTCLHQRSPEGLTGLNCDDITANTEKRASSFVVCIRAEIAWDQQKNKLYMPFFKQKCQISMVPALCCEDYLLFWTFGQTNQSILWCHLGLRAVGLDFIDQITK